MISVFCYEGRRSGYQGCVVMSRSEAKRRRVEDENEFLQCGTLV
jgi:hypothetical protein